MCQLKLAGWSHRIEAHIKQRVQPLADELRAVMVDRLDLCIERLHE